MNGKNLVLFGVMVSTVLMLVVIAAVTAPMPAFAASTTLLISEVQTGGIGNTNQEFIELYNVTGNPINLSDWKVAYRSASGSSNILVYQFSSGATVSGLDYFLLVHNGQNVGATPDGSFTTSLANAGGGLAILDSNGAVVDSLGWGTATNSFVEGVAATAPSSSSGLSLARTAMVDTDNNYNDFSISIPTPKGHVSAVPLPAAAWMLGSGLVGLIGIRGRGGKVKGQFFKFYS